MTEVNPGKTAASSTSSPAPALGMTDHAALRRAQRNANTLLWGIFILLLVLVGGVIFILPRYVSPYVSPPEPAAAQVAATNTPAAQTPFEDAQRLRLRDDAQNALQALLTLQDQLEQQGAARWAQNPFNAALALARQGDAAYAAQDYAAAREAYQNSLARLQDISANEATGYAAALAQGSAAYASGDTQAAIAAYDQALALQPQSAEAAAGKARAQTLAKVRDFLAAGHGLEASNQFDAAREQYQQAQALDPAQPEVVAALANIQRAIVDHNFAAAMSRGYMALQGGRATEARAAFQDALKIKPNAAEVNAALQQAKDQETFAKLNDHIKAAQRSEAAEIWAEALAAWEQALTVDPNLVSAQQGRQRSQSRGNLDGFLRGLIANPLRLTDTDARAQASQVLADAARIPSPGPVLQAQLQHVSEFLQQALVPASVQVQSDGLTQVTLLRVGELGAFTTHTLSLTPGTYTAVGIRPGYRDVRQDFVVNIDGQAPLVTIACNETI